MRGLPRGLILLVALALSACATGSGGGTPATPTVRAERPTYSLGDKWILDDGSYELVRIENDGYVFAAGPSAQIQLTRNLGLARIQRGESFIEVVPPLDLPWPLRVGKSGWAPALWRSPGFAGQRITFDWSVDAYEDVEVVAGQELYEYLEQQVTQKSRPVGGNQHPVMKGELEGVLPLVKVGGR